MAVPVLFLLCKGVRRAGEEALWVRRGLVRFGVLVAPASAVCLERVALLHWDIFNTLFVGVMGVKSSLASHCGARLVETAFFGLLLVGDIIAIGKASIRIDVMVLVGADGMGWDCWRW